MSATDEGRIGLIDYHAGVKLARSDPPFYALLTALIMRADTINTRRLQLAFPVEWAEVQSRYDAPGGALSDSERAMFDRMFARKTERAS